MATSSASATTKIQYGKPVDAKDRELRGAEDLAALYGNIDYDRGAIEGIFQGAVDQEYAAKQAEYDRSASQYYNRLAQSQDTYLDALRKQAATNAVQSGASQGMGAATQLSALMDLSRQTSADATELTQEQRALIDQQEAARAKATMDALTYANEQKMALGTLGANIYASDAQKYIGELGAGAQIEAANTAASAQGYTADQALAGQRYASDKQLEGVDLSSGRQLEGTRYSADQALLGTRYTADQQLAGVDLSSGRQLEGTRYTADQNLAGTRYASDQSLAGTRYAADQNLAGQKSIAGATVSAAQAQASGQVAAANIGLQQTQINADVTAEVERNRNITNVITASINAGGGVSANVGQLLASTASKEDYNKAVQDVIKSGIKPNK